MRHPAAALSLVVGLLGAIDAGAQMVPAAPSLGNDESAALEAGEVLVDVDADGPIVEGLVMGVVDASTDEVWEVIADFGGQDQWIPDVYDTSVIRTEGDAQIVAGNTDAPFPISDRVWQIRMVAEESSIGGVASHVARWTEVPDVGNMPLNQGYWIVQPFEGSADRTLVVYHVRVDSGIPVPDAIESNATRRMFPGFIHNLRERVQRRRQGF